MGAPVLGGVCFTCGFRPQVTRGLDPGISPVARWRTLHTAKKQPSLAKVHEKLHKTEPADAIRVIRKKLSAF
jgi:hypothetical protein